MVDLWFVDPAWGISTSVIIALVSGSVDIAQLWAFVVPMDRSQMIVSPEKVISMR